MPPAPSARVRGLAALVVAALTAAVLALVMSAPPAHASDVGISNYAFSPASIEVHPGDSVTWTNHDKVPHLVTTADNRFQKSPVLKAGQSFSNTFATAGTYSYFCSIHPQMTGKIIVR